MSVEVIWNSIQKAKKEYGDDAYEFISECIDNFHWWGKGQFTIAELRVLVGVKQRRKEARMIMPGDIYVRQRNKVDGDVFTFRAKKLFHDICSKHDMYPEV